MNFKRSFTPLAMVLACAAPLAAQETVGTLVGTVTNSGTGKPLAGVKLILRSPKMLGERTTTTAPDGGFRIPLLPNGDYSITTSTEGYNNSTVRFAVTPGQTTRQNIRLAPIQTVTVEVVADSAAQVDKTETSTQTIFSMDSIKALTGGDLARITELAPAVVTGSTANGNTIAVRGGNTTGARMLLNGLDASDPGWGTFNTDTQMVSEMVETVAIISSPLNARYGNTESGMLSYVTTRGSNDFKGSIRATYSVNGTYGYTWQSYNNGDNDYYRYGQRTGTNTNPRWVYAKDGSANRNWEATISGPIWKDHITFAWGGRIYPSTVGTGTVSTQWVTAAKLYTATGGILLPLDTNGGEIRRAELYDTGKTYSTSSTTTFNQYAIFWQINANHSIDYSYSEYKAENSSLYDGSIDLSSGNYSTEKDANRIYNISYKGLVGPGVLEMRFGRTVNAIIRPDTSGDEYANIFTGTTQTNYTNGFTSSVAEGFSSSQDLDGTLYPYSNYFEAKTNSSTYFYNFYVSGSPYDRSESKENTSFTANYQVALGNHLLDLGVNTIKTHWDTALPTGGNTVISGTGGQIATDLTDSDILYPTGYTGVRANAAAYAGKWVVWDAHALTTKMWADYPDEINSTTQYAYATFGAPQMKKYWGQDNGAYDEKTDSIYANDIWSFSNKFTFMGGLRWDKFKLSDSVGTVLSYGMLSPRFQVKYDINGDQKRVVSYSWAKFHNRIPSAAFQSLVHRRKAYYTAYDWDGRADGSHVSTGVDASGSAYEKGFQVVSTTQLKDPDNYTYYVAQQNPDLYKLGDNFKADYNIEQVLAFQRAYDNGSNWKASIIYRKWFNNYQWFMDPHCSYIVNPYGPKADETSDKETDTNWNAHRVLRNDPGLFHTYHSFELEWNFVLSHTVTLSGNYTYSRNYSNQMYYAAQSNFSQENIGLTHTPWGTNFPEVWALVGLSLDDIAQKSVVRDQVAHAWVTWDLSRGVVKQSLVFRAAWDLGATYTQWATSTSIDPTSTAWKAILAHAKVASDFPTSTVIGANYGKNMYLPYPGTNIGDNKAIDNITYTLKYNLDVPISNSLHWWVGIEITNPFNSAYERNQVDYQVGNVASSLNGRKDTFRVDGSTTGAAIPGANGFRMTSAAMLNKSNSYYDGVRYFTLETGIRF